MRDINTFTSCLVGAACGFLIGFAPASAQCVEDPAAVKVNTQRTVHQITGWQNDLVSRTPNLGNYYWTPVSTVEQATTTQRTGKGAVHIPTVVESVPHYVKPKTGALPDCSHNAAPPPPLKLSSSYSNHPFLHVRRDGSETLQSSTAAHGTVLTYRSGQENVYARASMEDTRSRNLSVSGRVFSGSARQ